MNNDLISIRRYVDADNSCLFSSIAYLINPIKLSETSKFEYRMMIAEYLISNKDKNLIPNVFSDIFDRNKYIEEIQDINKWGGAIELKLFSDIFEIKIGSIDIQTNRVDIYGQDKIYNKIIYIIYNGAHYDPLVMNFTEFSNKESDITKFDINDHNVLIRFKNLANIFKENNDFVDINNLNNLECNDCKEQFKDENDASKHAESIGHYDFNQIS